MSEAAVRDLIARLRLAPHPEGGWYRETYRAAPVAGRSASTAILFLLPAGAKSRLHRIPADELWHFHLGGPLTVSSISPSGELEEAVLGPELAAGHALQHVVPAGSWFGAAPDPGTEFSLVACTVAPGFEFADLELGRRDELLESFPGARAVIEKLTD